MAFDKRAIEAARAVKIESHHFHSRANQILFRTLLDLEASGKLIDDVILREELKRRGVYETVGGDRYVTGVIAQGWTAALAPQYADLLLERARDCEFVALVETLHSNIHRHGVDREVLAIWERGSELLATPTTQQLNFVTAAEVAQARSRGGRVYPAPVGRQGRDH